MRAAGAGPELAALLEAGGPSGPAAWGRRTLAQAAIELRLTLRQGENLLVTVVIPIVLLVFFAGSRIATGGRGRAIDFLLPGILTLAVMSTGMVSLGIATGYQRAYGVLKRLGGSPLGPPGLLVGKGLSVLAIEVVQVMGLGLVAALGYGWRAHGAWPLALVVLAVGATTFAALGLLLASGLRAEVTLGAANGLYLLFLVLGGVVLPVSHLPGFIQPLARVLPATALSQGLRAALGPAGRVAPEDWALLAVWLAGSVGLAVRRFRWE